MQNSFVIKKVKSSRGKRDGIPQDLRAFACVLSATSVEARITYSELQEMTIEAAENDGRLARRPLKNKKREIHAHCILLVRLNYMIQGYSKATEELKTVDDSAYKNVHSVRKQTAKDLLGGELRVLQSAHAWLENYYMEHRIKCMLLLLGEEADSFAKKAEMYYRRRPEVIGLVEEVYRAYRALSERYDHISGELHKANHTIATAFPDQVQYAMLEEEDDNMPKAFTPVNPGKIHKSTVEGLMERKKKKEGGLPGPKGGRSKLAAPISKENAKAEISRLQKAILVVQTEKEFIKSSYESGIAKYWDLEKQINDMQEKVCYFQDQFNESAVIEDDEARALMTATALKSCQDTIVKLQEQQMESTRQARVQSQRLKVSTEKLKGVCGKSLSDSVHSSDKDVRKDCGVESEDVYSMKQEMFELQTMIDKIKEHFEKDSNLSLGEVVEKIDELVNEAVDLELQVSSQSAQVNRLCLENTELEKSLQSLEEEKAVLASGSGSLNDKLKQAEEELMRVKTLASSFYSDESAVCSNFTKAISSFSDISEMLQSPVLEHQTDSGLMLANKEKAAAPIDTRPSGDYSDKPKAIKDPSIYPSTDSSEKLHSPNLNASNSKSSSGFNETKEKKPDNDYDACGDPNKRREAKVHESVSSMDSDMKSNGRQERSSLEKGSLVRLRHISSESLGDVDSEQEGIRKQDSSTSGDAIPNKAEDSKMRENSTLTSGNASEVGDQDGSMIKLQQLLINGLQDKENVLLAEYTSILQNYKDAKRTLREVETKNQVRLHELTAVISELRCANAIKDEEIRSLRDILSSFGDKDTSRNGHHQRNLGTCSSDRKDSSRRGHRRTPSFSSTHQRKQSVSSISKLIRSNASLQGEGHESNDAATDSESISLDDLKVPNVVEMENTPPLEQKFRRDIDTLLEENLEFWMKFSTSLQRIQEFQTNHSELKSAIDGLTNDVKQEVNSGDTTKTHESSAMEKGLRALKTELQVCLEQNAMLKGELKGRCTSLCNIQEEIAAALEMDADVEVEGARFTSYQAAKFQGEVLNMQQENNRVANELQAGFDHVKGLQEEVEKALARLHKSVSLSSIGSSSGDSSNHSGRHAPSNSNPKVPLQSFLFPTKNKKPSLLAYVNPVLQKHQADIKFLAKLG